jgi:hypothetical protein
VETGADPPSTERMEEHLIRVFRLVRVELVEQVVTGMGRIRQGSKFCSEHADLSVIKNSDSPEIAVLVKERDLIRAQRKAPPAIGRNWQFKKVANQPVLFRKIFLHLSPLSPPTL